MIDDGGPAFPGFQYEPGSGCCNTTHGPDGIIHTEVYDTGMTLRDWFAGQSLGLLSQPLLNAIHAGNRPPVSAEVADLCYKLADAMIAARTPKGTP
jgi:hypothetical protein